MMAISQITGTAGTSFAGAEALTPGCYRGATASAATIITAGTCPTTPVEAGSGVAAAFSPPPSPPSPPPPPPTPPTPPSPPPEVTEQQSSATVMLAVGASCLGVAVLAGAAAAFYVTRAKKQVRELTRERQRNQSGSEMSTVEVVAGNKA